MATAPIGIGPYASATKYALALNKPATSTQFKFGAASNLGSTINVPSTPTAMSTTSYYPRPISTAASTMPGAPVYSSTGYQLPMGTKSASPAGNITPPTNTLSGGQVAKVQGSTGTNAGATYTPANAGFGGGTAMTLEQLRAAGAPTEQSIGVGNNGVAQGNPVTGATAPNNSFSGLIGQLLAKASEQQKAQQDVETQFGKKAMDITGQFGGTATDETGRLAQLENIKQSTLGNIAASYGTPISALGTAIGAAAPSGSYPFVFNPLTGQYSESAGVGGASGGGGIISAQDAAKAVSDGTMSYPQAVSSLGYLGGTGEAQLQAAIRGINPNFNFAQAQSLSGTQGEVAPALTMAQNSLSNLQSTFNNTPWYQKFGTPLLNSFTNLLAGFGVGTGTESSKQNAISEARTQVANALGTMMNTTPSAWTAMVESWFPDNATPEQVSAGIQQFNNLAQYRQQTYGTPGSVTPFTQNQNGNTNSGSNPPGWF